MAHGVFHTHPSLTGEPVYGCLGGAQVLNDGKPVPLARPNENGGGSTRDWENTDHGGGYPIYAYTKDGVVYRLDPNTPPAARAQNPHKWNLPRETGCPTSRP